MDAVSLIALKRAHLNRLANTSGAAGERDVLSANSHFIPRPKGRALDNLIDALKSTGITIKKTSFDAIALPEESLVDFFDSGQLRSLVSKMIFVEIKTASQPRVRSDFGGFFFAFTEGEIQAADALGDRHRVMLHNKLTGTTLLTSIPELLARARSTTWQVSVQL